MLSDLEFVDPLVSFSSPALDFGLSEPQFDFILGIVDGVRSVNDVSSGVDAVVTSDGSGGGVEGVGGTNDLSAGGDDSGSLPDHGDDGAHEHVVDQSLEELLLLEISVVGLDVVSAGGDHLEGNKLVASGFESVDDGSNKSSLDSVGLNHNVGSF